MKKKYILMMLALVLSLCLGMTAFAAELPEGETAADSSLSYLKVIPGELSPEFDPEVLEYSVTVEPNHTKLAISAKPTVESSKFIVSNTYLEVGTNVITVKVTAEDGSLTTYTLTVLRPEESIGAGETKAPTEPETTAPTTEVPVTEEKAGHIPIWAFFLLGLAIGGIILTMAVKSAVKQMEKMKEDEEAEEESETESKAEAVAEEADEWDDVFEFLDEEPYEEPEKEPVEELEEEPEVEPEEEPEEDADEFEFFDL